MQLRFLLQPSLLMSLLMSTLPLGAGGDQLPVETAVDQVRATVGEVSSVRVTVANVREGGIIPLRADLKDSSDRRAFARRVHAQPGRVPDVVLLQEVLGNAEAMARALNDHPRARKTGARYTVATTTSKRRVRNSCAGWRPGTFPKLRSSAILINERTVRGVARRGEIRTWGKWGPQTRRHLGGSTVGCTAHPWARLTVKHGQRQARDVLVTSVHVAPLGTRMQNQAIMHLRERIDALHRRSPGAAVVIAGDMNLNRCFQPLRSPEPENCLVRNGHRALLDAGYKDAVRIRNRGGRDGVVGVARRIDFIYTKSKVSASSFDRCYQAFFVHRYPCIRSEEVFSTNRAFLDCQRRSLHHGRPGKDCPPARFHRYYSDHPAMFATIR